MASRFSIPHNWAVGDDGRAASDDEGETDWTADGWVIGISPSQIKSQGKKRMRGNQADEVEFVPRSSSKLSPPPFTIDTTGNRDAIDEARLAASESNHSSRDTSSKSRPMSLSGELLLPEHVKMVQHQSSGGVSDEGSTVQGEEADREDIEGELGHFTQIDRDTSVPRYYDVAAAEERKALKECEICGEKGHTKKDCNHTLCASCGVTDQHTTRDCPVGILCFRCGQRGHRRNECQTDPRRMPRNRDCSRCGSHNHTESTCPTYWRIYAYVDEEEWLNFRTRKAATLRREQEQLGGCLPSSRKRSKRRRSQDSESDDMNIESSDSGSEDRSNYDSKFRCHTPPRSDWDPAERWCYNCAARGTHWGDDCPLPRRAHHRNAEPSIFSEFVSRTGPFASRLHPPPRPEPTAPVAGIYDVSVGLRSSMHFFGANGRDRATRPTIEEEIEKMFARAPNASRRQVENERNRRREMDRRKRQPQHRLFVTTRSNGLRVTGNPQTDGLPQKIGRNGIHESSVGPTDTDILLNGTNFNNEAQQRQRKNGVAGGSSNWDVHSIIPISSGDDDDIDNQKNNNNGDAAPLRKKKTAKMKVKSQEMKSRLAIEGVDDTSLSGRDKKAKRTKRDAGSNPAMSLRQQNDTLMPSDSTGVSLASGSDLHLGLHRRREQSQRNKACHAEILKNKKRQRKVNDIARPGESAFGQFADSMSEGSGEDVGKDSVGGGRTFSEEVKLSCKVNNFKSSHDCSLAKKAADKGSNGKANTGERQPIDADVGTNRKVTSKNRPIFRGGYE